MLSGSSSAVQIIKFGNLVLLWDVYRLQVFQMCNNLTGLTLSRAMTNFVRSLNEVIDGPR